MIDRALGFGSPVRREAFYFQFWPNSISFNKGSTAPPPGSSIKFSVYKGPQKFNENKTATQISSTPNEKTYLKKCQLNFYLPDFSPTRKIDFVIKLVLITNQEEVQVGSYNISTAQLVNLFNEDKVKEVKKVQHIGEYLVEFDLFTQKTRYNLQKVVKQVKDKQQETQATDSQPTQFASQSKQAPSQTSSRRNKRFERVRKEETPTSRFKSVVQQQKKEEKVEISQKSGASKKQQTPYEEKTQSKNPQIKISKLKSKTSTQSAASPALGDAKMMSTKKVKVAGQVKNLKESSRRLAEQHEQKVEQKKSGEGSSTVYNIKILLFLIISFFLMYEAMTPSRRAPYKKGR